MEETYSRSANRDYDISPLSIVSVIFKIWNCNNLELRNIVTHWLLKYNLYKYLDES